MDLHIVLYLVAEDEKCPVAKAATYLQGDAVDWWQHRATYRCHQMLTLSSSLRPFPSTLSKLLTVLKHGASFSS